MQKGTPEKNTAEMHKRKQRRKWMILGILYLLFMLLVVCIVNSRHLGDFINGILAAFRPVIIGLLIAYITNPLYNFLHDSIFNWEAKKPRDKQHRGVQSLRKIVSMVFTYAVVVLFIIVFVMLLLPQLTSSIQDLSQNLQMYVNETLAYVNELLESLHLPFDIPTLNFEYVLSFLPGDDKLSGLEKLTSLLTNVASIASTYVAQLIGLVIDIVVGLFIAGYTLAAKQRLSAQIRRLLTAVFHEKGCNEIIDFVRETDSTFGRYVVGKLTDSMLVIVVASIAFSLAGIPYAILVGFIIGATNIIPFFGPIFGAVPCGILVFIAEPRKIFTFIILVLVIQQIDANIIDPLITGNATGLSSLGVIVAVTVMGNLFGVGGMILGVPVTVSLLKLGKIFLDRKLAADHMPLDLDPYYSKEAAEEDKGSGEHTPLFTRLAHHMQNRRAISKARTEAKKSGKKNSRIRRSMTEDDIFENDYGTPSCGAPVGKEESAEQNENQTDSAERK